MMTVVSEKTGYPEDMLELSMDMEADLGIDSIKRVEILSGIRVREPNLPEVDTKAMAALNTLGEIVKYMEDSVGSNGTATASTSEEPPRPKASSAATS